MSITIRADGQEIGLKRFNFSAGEVQIRLLDPPEHVARWDVTAHVHDSDTLMALMLVGDAIRRLSPAPMHLLIPYLPYSRQDRAAWTGEAFALSVLGRMLALHDWAEIVTWDVHSPVSLEQVPRLRSIPAAAFVRPHLKKGERVVAPDKGAVERSGACADDAHRLLRAIKRRDPDTGDVRDPELLDALGPDEPVLVVDDICDGGRTFTHLGRFLRTVTRAPLRLYVTHGIFSQGLGELREIFDEVLCANLFDPSLADQVTLVPLPAGQENVR